MRLTCEFESFEEMMEFAAKLQQEKENQPVGIETETVQSKVTATPVNTQVQDIAVPPVSQPAGTFVGQNMPHTITPEPVQTTTPTYNLDDLSRAAMVLMDRGMQAQLQQLLAGYGVVSLPELPKEQYGNFATALRGMGAQI